MSASRRRWLLMTVLAPGSILLAACSSGSSSPTSTGSANTTAGSSTSTPASSTAPASTIPGSTTTAVAGSTSCAAAALSGTIAGSSGAAGTIETTVGLRNTGATACTLGGYPGLLLLDAAGTALPTTVVRKGSYSFTAMSPTTVSVSPDASVYFNIGYSDVPVGSETSCPSSATVEITPPNAFDHLEVAATLSPCGGGSMTVSPVFSATGANSQTTAPPGG